MTEISETLCPRKNLPKNNSSGESQIGEGDVWHDEGDYYGDDTYDEECYYKGKDMKEKSHQWRARSPLWYMLRRINNSETDNMI